MQRENGGLAREQGQGFHGHGDSDHPSLGPCEVGCCGGCSNPLLPHAGDGHRKANAPDQGQAGEGENEIAHDGERKTRGREREGQRPIPQTEWSNSIPVYNS
jgi:hypothetical protein